MPYIVTMEFYMIKGRTEYILMCDEFNRTIIIHFGL